MSNIVTQTRGKARLNVPGLLAAGMLLALPAASAAEQPLIAEQIAKAYGLGSWEKVETLRYTWNIELPGGKTISNKWEWSPKTNTVSFDGKDKAGNSVKVTYQRSQLDSQSDVVKKEVDPQFANDQYWTLLPFHLLWDGAAPTDDGIPPRDILLLRLRSLLARARGDETAYRDFRDRYRAGATSLGFEGHMAWAEAMS